MSRGRVLRHGLDAFDAPPAARRVRAALPCSGCRQTTTEYVRIEWLVICTGCRVGFEAYTEAQDRARIRAAIDRDEAQERESTATPAMFCEVRK